MKNNAEWFSKVPSFPFSGDCKIMSNELVLVSSDVAPVTPIVETTPDTVNPVVDAPVAKRGRGRPQVYAGAVRAYIISLIGLHGLTKTRKVLNNSGAVRKAIAKKFGVDYATLQSVIPHKQNISMLKLFQLGREGGIVLERGRPKTKAAVVAEVAAEVASAPVAG